MKNYTEERPKVGVAAEFLADVLPMIRRQFCPEWDDRAWNTHLWLVRRAVTFPAVWLNKRAIFVGPGRYRELVLELLQEIKVNARGEIKFPPGYLLKCVQDHMRFNADRYNAEGKAARDVVARAMAGVKGEADAARADEMVRSLAAAAACLAKPKRRAANRPAPDQLGLF